MTTSTTPSPSARPGGRSARIRAAVHVATQELLLEREADTLTIPIIATRAGVHSTTLYRRWGSVGELLADVTANRLSGEVLVPDTGTLREDLERWASDVAVDLADPDTTALMRVTIGTNRPEGSSACTADRRDQLDAILGRERDRGGDAPSTDRAADHLLGPLYYRAIFRNEPASPEWARELVGELLR